MKRVITPLIAGALVAACGSGDATGPAATVTTTADGWQVLFDGSSLEHWNVLGDANWTIDGDTVRADSSSGASFLVSHDDYGDFDLTLEFWVDVPANSGVFIRCADPAEISAETCYEVNIFDTRPDPTYRTGSVVNFAAPNEIVNTGGRWNEYRIAARGPRLSATLNGAEMFDFEDDTFTNGPFALQYGSGTVIFRNVRIRTPAQ